MDNTVYCTIMMTEQANQMHKSVKKYEEAALVVVDPMRWPCLSRNAAGRVHSNHG